MRRACPICATVTGDSSRRFVDIYALTFHCRRAHLPLVTLQRETSLDARAETLTTDEQRREFRHQCRVCCKRFSVKRLLALHLETHGTSLTLRTHATLLSPKTHLMPLKAKRDRRMSVRLTSSTYDLSSAENVSLLAAFRHTHIHDHTYARTDVADEYASRRKQAVKRRAKQPKAALAALRPIKRANRDDAARDVDSSDDDSCDDYQVVYVPLAEAERLQGNHQAAPELRDSSQDCAMKNTQMPQESRPISAKLNPLTRQNCAAEDAQTRSVSTAPHSTSPLQTSKNDETTDTATSADDSSDDFHVVYVPPPPPPATAETKTSQEGRTVSSKSNDTLNENMTTNNSHTQEKSRLISSQLRYKSQISTANVTKALTQSCTISVDLAQKPQSGATEKAQSHCVDSSCIQRPMLERLLRETGNTTSAVAKANVDDVISSEDDSSDDFQVVLVPAAEAKTSQISTSAAESTRQPQDYLVEDASEKRQERLILTTSDNNSEVCAAKDAEMSQESRTSAVEIDEKLQDCLMKNAEPSVESRAIAGEIINNAQDFVTKVAESSQLHRTTSDELLRDAHLDWKTKDAQKHQVMGSIDSAVSSERTAGDVIGFNEESSDNVQGVPPSAKATETSQESCTIRAELEQNSCCPTKDAQSSDVDADTHQAMCEPQVRGVGDTDAKAVSPDWDVKGSQDGDVTRLNDGGNDYQTTVAPLSEAQASRESCMLTNEFDDDSLKETVKVAQTSQESLKFSDGFDDSYQDFAPIDAKNVKEGLAPVAAGQVDSNSQDSTNLNAQSSKESRTTGDEFCNNSQDCTSKNIQVSSERRKFSDKASDTLFDCAMKEAQISQDSRTTASEFRDMTQDCATTDTETANAFLIVRPKTHKLQKKCPPLPTN